MEKTFTACGFRQRPLQGMRSLDSSFPFIHRMEANCCHVLSVFVRLIKKKGALRLVYRVTGPKTGTESFSRLHAGAQLELLGPLGNGFPLEEAAGRKVFLMGGGIGVPPMLETMKQLDAKKIAVLGYRDELFLNEEFEKNGEVYIATEDGSAGTRGKCNGCDPGE